ncbi:hypothetical protein [Saccharomonospora marina]|uniref:hypothetical protein n=1 Tax=Saccharomonospora marina TaxID=632569 RepID=UPI0002F183F4|nr:hypothetical protein [Saccharomonospora marina]
MTDSQTTRQRFGEWINPGQPTEPMRAVAPTLAETQPIWPACHDLAVVEQRHEAPRMRQLPRRLRPRTVVADARRAFYNPTPPDQELVRRVLHGLRNMTWR